MYDYEEIRIELPDGYAAYARYWPVDSPRGAVLYLHGIQSHCGWYEDSAHALQQAGFAVLQPDRRGSGRNTTDRGHGQSPGQLIEDGLACGTWLQDRTQFPRYHVLGVSWGGKLASAMYVFRKEPVCSLTLVCPGIFPRVDVSSAEKFRIGVSMLCNPDRMYDIPLNDPQLFTSHPKWIEFLNGDMLMLKQVTASFFLATRRMDSVIRELPKTTPVPTHLLVSGEDRIIDSDKTEQFFEQLHWPAMRITRYPHARHTLEFEENIRGEYFTEVVRWMDEIARSE